MISGSVFPVLTDRVLSTGILFEFLEISADKKGIFFMFPLPQTLEFTYFT